MAFVHTSPLWRQQVSRLRKTCPTSRSFLGSTIRPITPPARNRFIPVALSDDPVETRVREELAANGVNLDELLNAGKVVNLARNLDNLTVQCASLPTDSSEFKDAKRKMAQIEHDLVREKRQVMQRWLKQLFSAQAILFLAIGGVLSYDIVPGYSVPLVGRALGFWMTWLFSIPSLRARKGTAKWEKSALNVAFLATPLLNVVLPTFTKNCGTIWGADVALLLGCYAYYSFVAPPAIESAGQNANPEKEQGRVKGVLKYLDWGSWR